MISLNGPDGQHVAELSIKSNRQITEAGFPDNFVETCWEEWLHVNSAVFQNDRDLLVLATRSIAVTVVEAWHKTLRESLCTSPERMLARLASPPAEDHGAQSSSLQRRLFSSLHCPEPLKCNRQSDELATLNCLSVFVSCILISCQSRQTLNHELSQTAAAYSGQVTLTRQDNSGNRFYVRQPINMKPGVPSILSDSFPSCGDSLISAIILTIGQIGTRWDRSPATCLMISTPILQVSVHYYDPKTLERRPRR